MDHVVLRYGETGEIVACVILVWTSVLFSLMRCKKARRVHTFQVYPLVHLFVLARSAQPEGYTPAMQSC